jgi:tetratricopeptide (TPR) repeat protein
MGVSLSSGSRAPVPASPSKPPLILALTAFLAGCTGLGTVVETPPVDLEVRGYRLLPKPLTLPKSHQSDDCVPEALCAIMSYWDRPVSVPELALLGRQMGLQGMVFTSIPAVARRRGFHVEFIDGTVQRIRSALDRGVPPLIGAKVGPDTFHAFVVTGYSDREQSILCEEYEGRKRFIGYAELEEAWAKSGHLMLELRPSEADELTQTGADREAKGRYAEAAELYAKALGMDPAHYEARVGLGNCRYFQGRREDAVLEYRKARETNGADPKLANNLASVLVELGRDLAEAEDLAGRAVDAYGAAERAAREAMDREPLEAVKARRRKEHREAGLDLADALGTLAQVRAANGRHDLAVAAATAALDHYPLTESDARAKRHLEIALSSKALGMASKAREHLERAKAEAKDPVLQKRIADAASP